MLVFFLASVARWNEAADVATAVGAATAVIGTLVGAFFGIQMGAEGTAEAEAASAEAEKRAMILAAHLDPRLASKVLGETAPAGVSRPAKK